MKIVVAVLLVVFLVYVYQVNACKRGRSMMGAPCRSPIPEGWHDGCFQYTCKQSVMNEFKKRVGLGNNLV